ncbi:MAG: APC family permease, partial [Ilumatobacteraceae bacterium]|nr:APC family permease [Ilumatobacteraceae bacterium]
MTSVFKRVLIGSPIASSEEQHQRISKKVALPVFASDAISSTAYATQEILIVFLSLAAAGAAAYDRLVPISLMVIVLLAIVASSYRQTIYAYPSGGGSYVVSKENLGRYPSLVAGGSLLVDYILTVAVSVSGGVAAIVSAFNDLEPYRVHLCVGFIVLMTLANLRGLKESGALFAPPTYLYIVSLALLIVVGLYRVWFQDLPPIDHSDPVSQELLAGQGAITLYFFLKAFASGAVALTGVEAVSNGVPAFRKPESKNASTTLIWMATILGTLFFGISVLAKDLQPVADEEGLITNTVLAQMAEHVYGGRNVMFFVMQFATFAILILAANTAYADYPRLSSIIAKDGYLPRQLTNRGDRLVFSNGIIVLSLVAIALVIAFGGNVTALIPLYAIGVFTGFTLSQTGMCVHHYRYRERRWRLHMVVNAIGAVTTAIVALIVVVVKFTDGAWIPAALIPILVIAFMSIHRHYERVAKVMTVAPGFPVQRHTHYVVVLVGSINKGVLQAIGYARSLAPDRLIAVSVVQDHEEEV